MPRGAVIIGGYINGLGLMRALAARGIPTAVITTQPFDIAQHSRWACAQAAVRDLDQHPERLVAVLASRAAEWAGWALIPTNDDALAALARHHEHLSATFRVVAPPQEVAHYFLDKQEMLGVAAAVGVDLPHCYGSATESTVDSADLRFPVLVKPNSGNRFFARFGRKLFVAKDRAELRRAVARLHEAQLEGQIFDFVPGPDSEIYAYCTYVDARGEPHPGVTIRKLRQSPPSFGVACVAEIAATDPALRHATIAILRRIHFRGMAAAEFKRDLRDGRLRFIEINGRSVLYNRLLREAGLDLAALAWLDYVDGDVMPATPTSWSGVWVNLHADLLYALRDRAPVSAFVAPYRRQLIEAVWSARDPLPFVAQWGGTARRLFYNRFNGLNGLS